MKSVTYFENPNEVRIEEDQWTVKIRITTGGGIVHEYRASAEEVLTCNDGIWFDTEEEYAKSR